MDKNSERRLSLASFLATKINEDVEEIVLWLKEYEFSQNITQNVSPDKRNCKSVSKGFSYPPGAKEKGRQKIPLGVYEALSSEIRESICNRTIKSAGEMFVCGAFPITEDNRCHRCIGTKKVTVEKNPKIDTSTLNTGLGKKLHIRLFSTNFSDIFASNSFQIEDVIFRGNVAIGYLEGVRCELEKTGEVFNLESNWEEKLLPLDDQRKKYLGRFSDIKY